MTSTRPYRRGMPKARAGHHPENLGDQFDSELGERFIQLGEAGRFDHIIGHSEPGIPLQCCQGCGPIIAVPRSGRRRRAVLSQLRRRLSAVAARSQPGAGAVRTLQSGAGAPAARDPGLIDDLLLGAEPLLQMRKPSLLERLFG